MTKKISFVTAVVALVLPMLVSAFNVPNRPAGNLVDIKDIIDRIFFISWPIFGSIAVVMLMWLGLRFIMAQGDASKPKEISKALIWSLVGIAVLLMATTLPYIITSIIFAG